ncbi:MAG: hypothetical protein Q9161_009126 [Pseudevernia consocians]
MSTLSFHNFSWKGDPKWWNASSWTRYGPIVVCVIFAIAIVQLVCGSIWIVQLGNNLTVPMIIQTLLIPGCSFFNAIPSIHLHMLLRNNPPKMAIWFSSIFVILYLCSAILSLAACAGSSPSGIPHGLRHAECPQGTPGGLEHGVSKAVWGTMVAFQFLSVVGYGIHGGMAYKVHRVLKGRRDRGEVEALDPEQEEARKQKARVLWERSYRMEGL